MSPSEPLHVKLLLRMGCGKAISERARWRSIYSSFRKDGPASSWTGPDAKCLKMASVPTVSAENITPGAFGHAEFSARGPRHRFQAILKIFEGSTIWGKFPGH